MEDSNDSLLQTSNEISNNLSSLKEAVTSMSNQCLDIQRELSFVLTQVTQIIPTQELEGGNTKKTDTNRVGDKK